jgi:DeoR family ulaG and ulaABCDEF operon transcriptional repressor
MLSAERRELILRLLRRGRFVAVGDIAGLAETSEATVRRDLAALEADGLVRRVRGGAELAAEDNAGAAAGAGRRIPAAEELPFEYRKGLMLERKRRIAKAAAALCADEETLIIDGGSTTFMMTEFLSARGLQVITNSFAIAERLVRRPGCTVILNGGIVYPESQLILDPFAGDMFSNYTASKAFMGIYGIDETGATNTEMLLIKTERAMIERARELVVLADSSKFDRRGSLFLCGFDRIRVLITDSGIPERYREMMLSKGVKLVVA